LLLTNEHERASVAGNLHIAILRLC